MLLARLLRGRITAGGLTVIDAAGERHGFGDPGGAPRATVRLHRRSLHYSLFLSPKLRVGEAYTDGTLTVEEGTLGDFLEVCLRNVANLEAHPLQSLAERASFWLRHLQQANPIHKAGSNVAPHYEAADSIADLFLDRDRQYSCAYCLSEGDSLERAQEARKRRMAAKLLLAPGQTVLDIGCGWGGLALSLARAAEVEVTGVTLSPGQHAFAEKRAAAAGFDGRVRFRLRDYREETGPYDRIVSAGMFEHVGVRHYPEYFLKLKSLLAEDGVALVNAIGRMEPGGTTTPWTRKYIFPGGYAPALSEVLAAIETAGLWVTDIEISRLHYADTMREWRRRLQANRAAVEARHDARFYRMFEFYLTACEVAFRHLNQMNFEIQLARRIDAVPLRRDYIRTWEEAQPLEAFAAQ